MIIPMWRRGGKNDHASSGGTRHESRRELREDLSKIDPNEFKKLFGVKTNPIRQTPSDKPRERIECGGIILDQA